MAFWNRKSRDEKMAEVVAEAVKAGLSGSPYANSGYNVATPAEPYPGMAGQGLVQTIGQAVPMDRPGGAFGAMLGPAAPLLPAPIDVVLDDSGRAMPRRYEYQVATNLNLTQQEVPYQILRSLVEQCDIVHRAAEIRVNDIVKQGWTFALSDECINNIMQEQNCSHAKASRIGRDKYGDEINRLNAFWENPYVAGDRSWTEWITEALWQIITFDQLCVYPRYSLGKSLIGLDIIDAPTIKILLDNRGDIPHPPAPAYQQVLWGFPRGEFTASPDSDGEFYNGVGRNGEFLTDQMAVFVKNRRTWSPSGFSPVEEAIPAATLYLDRQAWMRAEYQAGTMPQTFMKTNSMELSIEKLAAYERILNDRLTGSTAERHRIKVLPDGFDPVAMPNIDERFKADYDEFIIKRIAAIFGVSPNALGVIARAGLGGGKGAQQGEQDNSESVSTRPMENYITDVINSLSRRFLQADKNVTFILNDSASAEDEFNRAKALQTALFSGQKTLNDVQGELGQSLYDMPEADEPFIVAGNAIQFLKGMLDVSTTGETVGQNGPGISGSSNAQGPEEGQDAQGQGPQGIGQAPVSQGQEAQAGLKKDEAKAFARFVSKPRSREFVFKYHTPEEAEVLKAQITDTPKGSITKRQLSDHPGFEHLKRVVKKHGPLITAALAASVVGIDKAIEQAMNANASQMSADHIARVASGAVLGNISFTGEAQTALKGLYKASIDSGKPGQPAEIGPRVQAMLDRTGQTIKGINDTTLSRIQTALRDGIAKGQSAHDIGTTIGQIVNDPTRGDVIAQTESNRAYCQATVDQIASTGADYWYWNAYESACDECADLESANPHDISDLAPPDHPSCQCWVTDAPSD